MQPTPEILEAMRRRTGQLPSSAGIQGGAQATQAPTSPIAQMGMSQMQNASAPKQPQSPNPLGEAKEALSQAAPNQEAVFIVKALADRLKNLS